MPRGVLAQLFPWPFVGVVVLLVVLIFLTPNLLLNGAPAAGSLATQAELIVDRAPGNNTTHFYVNGLGTVRYAEIRAYVATNVSWPPPPSASNLSWVNLSYSANALSAIFSSAANPLALNVSVTYVDAAGTGVEYYGSYTFYFGDTTLEVVPLAPGLANVTPTPIASLPLTLLLTATAPGTAP